MRFLITGSSGQVGTNLGLALLREGHEVRGVDMRPNTWTEEIETDLVDLVEVARGARWPVSFTPDCVVHLAARAKVHDLVLEPAGALENMEMAYAALEVARRHGTPLLLASSREVYGDIALTTTQEDHANHVVAQSPYSASKLASEALVHSYSQCYGLPCLVVRLSNVYGRFDNDLQRMERVIPLLVDRINRGRPVTIYGPEKVLDFTHVDDCVSALVLGLHALMGRKLRRDTLNISFGEGSSLLDLVGFIESSLGKQAEVECAPTRVGEITRYVGDVSRARALLGYDPEIPLKEGIDRYVTWWRDEGYL